MIVHILRTKEGAGLSEVRRSWVETEGVENRDDSACGLGHGGVLKEQRLPHQLGLLGPGHLPEVLRSQSSRPECFCDKVMISEQLVDTGSKEYIKLGRKNMGVNVNPWSGVARRLYFSPKLCRIGEQPCLGDAAFSLANSHQSIPCSFKTEGTRTSAGSAQRSFGIVGVQPGLSGS